MQNQPLAPVDTPAAKRAKRPRAAQACDRCRLKKYKCDEQYPCLHCKSKKPGMIKQQLLTDPQKMTWSVYTRAITGNVKVAVLQSKLSLGPIAVHTDIASYVTDLERKVEELSSKLRASESTQGASPRGPGAETTPCSMPNTSTPQELAKLPETRAESADSGENEINEFNHHTNGVEFHGSTSSAAIIGLLKKARDPRGQEEPHPRPGDGSSLISTLHNPSFSPSYVALPAQILSLEQHNYYFDQAHIFMNGYFENIHFVHPFIDKEDFLIRANDLWFNRSRTPEPSFVALYLSILSVGSLVRVWDEGTLAGLGRFEWSRKLFAEAQVYLNHLKFSNDLETVQCLYVMVRLSVQLVDPS